MATVMGLGLHPEESITFSEMRAWSEITGVALNAWEAETIRGLSLAYIAARNTLKDENDPAPYMTDESRAEFDRAASDRFLAALMRSD